MKGKIRLIDDPGNSTYDLSLLIAPLHEAEGSTFSSQHRLTLGKHDHCDIDLSAGRTASDEDTAKALKRVSRQHAVLQPARGYIKYTDISSNGTTVVRQGRVYHLEKNSTFYLHDGDKLYLGIQDISKRKIAYGPLHFVDRQKSLRTVLRSLFGLQ